MIVVVDNHDSFTHNLVQCLAGLGAEVRVVLNDAVGAEEVATWGPGGVVLGPGPGAPAEAGVTMDLLHRLGGRVPILGVCLGHQAIGHWLGARVVRASRPVHGRTSRVVHDGTGVFVGLPSPFAAMRYNSLVLDPDHVPETLHVHARVAGAGEVMGVRHRHLPIEGVQFHPESFLTDHGARLLANWLRRVRAHAGGPRSRRAA
jgi:anthranilate synthase/aminodeoxychorismate synthase-like glutamine amidotransferase